MSHINWKEALAKAGIAGGLVFLGSLQVIAIRDLVIDPVPALITAGIAAGIAFLSVLKTVEEQDSTTSTVIIS